VKQDVYKQIENHYRANRNTIVKKFRNTAGSYASSEDVVQEAYARALQYWNSYDAAQPLDRWFNRILLNCLSDAKKSERATSSSEDAVATEDEFPPNALDKLMLQDVRKLVDKEPDNIRTILDLYLFKQYKAKEISEIVPETHGNVRLIVHNFRKKLRDSFGESLND
jgi:RNA polymerase sigma factor (sigma-70 family)